jgi:hypothetical protein
MAGGDVKKSANLIKIQNDSGSFQMFSLDSNPLLARFINIPHVIKQI